MGIDVTSTHNNIEKKKRKYLERERERELFLKALQQIFPCVLLANGLSCIPMPELLTEDLKAMLNHKSKRTGPALLQQIVPHRSVSLVIPDLWFCHDKPEI